MSDAPNNVPGKAAASSSVGLAVVATDLRVCSDLAVEAFPGQPSEPFSPDGDTPAARRDQLDSFYKTHATYVARLAYRLVGREDEVDDIVQDVFVMLYRQLDRIRRFETIRAWLGTTTVRMCRRRLRVRRIGFLLRTGERVDVGELCGSGTSGEERAALWNIHRALQRVSVNARIAWVFRYLEQASIDEIARLCRCSKSTVKRRIADAHRAVKKAISDE